MKEGKKTEEKMGFTSRLPVWKLLLDRNLFYLVVFLNGILYLMTLQPWDSALLDAASYQLLNSMQFQDK